jgi:hypothetical protein
MFDRQLHCRDCGCRLQFHADHLERTPGATSELAAPWQHTPWSKIGVGVLLAVGLSYGLQQLCTAVQVAGTTSSLAGPWTTLAGLLVLHAVQGLSLVAGGAATSAGQSRGLVYGTVVGVIAGAVFLAMQFHQADGDPDLLTFAQPITHGFCGLLGGLVGITIWQPPPPIPLATSVPASALPRHSTTSRLLRGPVHYGRVFAGAFVVVAGVVWSNAILEYALHASNGTFTVSSHLQARLIGWEIGALATLLGAGVAGATTFNGFKQGLCVGLGASVVILGVQLGRDNLIPEQLMALVVTVFALSMAGGWFGGQLFPPMVAATPRRRSLSSL